MHEILSRVPLLQALSPDDLERLGQRVIERQLEKDHVLFQEGSPGDACFVIAEGELAITKRAGEGEVQVALRGPGEVIGEMALIDDAPRVATARARQPSVLIEIDRQAFNDLLASSPSAAMSMLHTFASRLRSLQATLHHSEKMAALGTMTAGVAHELNNPAGAARRAAEQLAAALDRLEAAGEALDALALDAARRAALDAFHAEAIKAASQPLVLDTLARSDREADLEAWLAEHNIPDAWGLAPVLVSAGFDSARLGEIAGAFPGDRLPAVLAWLAASFAARGLLAEIRDSAARISAIVAAMKEYAFLDQAPVQEVDIHKSLDNTLIMLQYKLKSGIAVARDYAPDLPPITAYGSELAQVWTNLIDNAADALGGSGNLRLHTYRDGDEVVVEISDDGPGVPESLQDRIFEPFFTTKEPGKGTGLGLYISRSIVEKHHGHMALLPGGSGATFQVRLPLDFNASNS